MLAHASSTLTTSDGDALAFRVDGSGPTMLIYNGLVSTPLHWRAWVAHYRARFAVLTWDYPGHGGSPRPRRLDRVGIAPFADQGHALLDGAGVARPAIVCGISMGVQSALEHYRRHPDDVRALVLLCGTYGHPLDRISRAPAFRRAMVAAVRAAGRRWASLVRRLVWPLLRTQIGRAHV